MAPSFSERRRRRPTFTEQKRRRSAISADHMDGALTSPTPAALVTSPTPAATKSHDVAAEHHRHFYHQRVKKLLKAAHILHYCSITILGIFVGQAGLKLFAMGAEFFEEKLEIFDAIIVVASFVLDVVFLEGVTEASEGDQAAALIMIFLLWRVLRIVNGLMITTKKRQEFRIKLQKRTRLRLEKRIEGLREDIDLQQKENSNLKALCQKKGALEEELVMCKPRRRTVVQMTTMTGLSSVASLSLGLSMSMSGGAGSAGNGAKFQAQLSMPQTTAPPSQAIKPRRASLSAILSSSNQSSPRASPRPVIKRQAALCPSPVNEHPDDASAADDNQVTVMSF